MEREIVKQYLAKQYHDGFGSDCIGYHGTSIETMLVVIDTGFVPCRTAGKEFWLRNGDLSFFPVKSKFPSHKNFDDFPNEGEVIDSTHGYANDIALEHYFHRITGMDLKKPYHEVRLCLSPKYRPDSNHHFMKYLKRRLKEKMPTAEEVYRILDESRERKGLIIGLREAVLENYKLLDGDYGEGDLRMRCPGGLDYRLITGIIPLGEHEKKFIEGIETMLLDERGRNK